MYFLNQEKIDKKLLKIIDPFLQKILQIHGDNIISILLYGLSAGDIAFNKKNRINLLIVFKSINIDVLDKSLVLIKKFQKKYFITPLFFSKRHIETSLDTFGVEFLDIKLNHILLYGEELFDNISIEKNDLRLRCEEQIKSLVIRLRQSYLEIGLSKKGLERLILDSFDVLLPILKSILFLRDIKIPRDVDGVIAQVAHLVDFKMDILLSIVKDVAGDEKIGGKTAKDFFRTYIRVLEDITEFVDKM